MSSSFRKKVVAKVEMQKYSPVAMVTHRGDDWLLDLPSSVNIWTKLSLGSMTQDFREYCAMSLMEQGIVGRISHVES